MAKTTLTFSGWIGLVVATVWAGGLIVALVWGLVVGISKGW